MFTRSGESHLHGPYQHVELENHRKHKFNFDVRVLKQMLIYSKEKFDVRYIDGVCTMSISRRYKLEIYGEGAIKSVKNFTCIKCNVRVTTALVKELKPLVLDSQISTDTSRYTNL